MSNHREEKRTKREIANMNERRRMQNINTGFQTLRAQLPPRYDGEKLSKAAILQHTSTHIFELESHIGKLVTQNNELIRLLNDRDNGAGGEDWSKLNAMPDWINKLSSQPPDCPSCRRKRFENNHKLDMDSSSPFGGDDVDGSGTDSSSEADASSIGQYGNNRAIKSARLDGNGDAKGRISRKTSTEETYVSPPVAVKPDLMSAGSQQQQQQPSYVDQMAEEVKSASESIKIETNDNGNILNLGQQFVFINPIPAPTPILNQNLQPRISKPNAIALPIDVPFVSSENGDNSLENPIGSIKLGDEQLTMATLNGSQLIFLKPSSVLSSWTNSALSTTTSSSVDNNNQQSPTDSDGCKQDTRRNLNSIVEAIRQLEGDELFDDKKKLIAEGKDLTNLVITTSSGIATSASVQQLIQARPGVIVVNNFEN